MTLPPEQPTPRLPPRTSAPPDAAADRQHRRDRRDGSQLSGGGGSSLERQVLSWALWDWATQPFNSVILTFVFTALYLTSDTFLDPAVAALGEGDPAYERALSELASALGWAITIAGILIAVLAPVPGQRADVAGRRKLWLGGATCILVACMVALFFVLRRPATSCSGISLIAAGNGVLRVRRRQLQRDARAGVDADDRRPGLRLRLGPRATSAASCCAVVYFGFIAARRSDCSGCRPTTVSTSRHRSRLRRLVRALRPARALRRARVPQSRRRRRGKVGFFAVVRPARAATSSGSGTSSATRVLVPARERGVPRRTRGSLHVRRRARGLGVRLLGRRGPHLRASRRTSSPESRRSPSGRFDDRSGREPVIITALIGL